MDKKKQNISKGTEKVSVTRYLEITKLLPPVSNFLVNFWQKGRKGIFPEEVFNFKVKKSLDIF